MTPAVLIRPRVFVKTTPQNARFQVYAAVADYLKSLEPVVKTSVQQKMRRGISPYEFSERGSVQTQLRVTGDRFSLGVFSNSVRAAVDETGARYQGVPPFGPGSALLEWVKATVDTTNPRWTAKRIAIAIHDRGLPRPGDALRRPFHTTHQELLPQVKEGLRRARSEAIRKVNERAASRRLR